MEQITNQYQDKEHIDFWTKTNPTVIGDMIGRPEAVQLLKRHVYFAFGDHREEQAVLDAGCGTGYVTRMVAKSGYQTYGIDKSAQMLESARHSEHDAPLKIQYIQGSIQDTLYGPDSFHGVISTGVLLHNTVEGICEAFLETRRILKDRGIAVVSVTHPSVYLPSSPCRTEKVNWVRFEPLEDLPWDQSQRFKEIYTNIEGKVIETELWHHPEHVYFNAAADAGLKLREVNTPMIRKEHLLIPEWGKIYDYPVFLQMVFEKR